MVSQEHLARFARFSNKSVQVQGAPTIAKCETGKGGRVTVNVVGSMGEAAVGRLGDEVPKS